MNQKNSLAAQFEASRAHLLAVAWRILGSRSEAEDAVQETWLRFAGADLDRIDNIPGWLTTVVARICLDGLRTRKTRREEPIGPDAEAVVGADDAERDAALADSVGAAMRVVLDTLAPPERVAFVLHDMFDVPFDQIAGVLRRSPMATRQLASRARRRIQGTIAETEQDQAGQREVVDAFFAASRDADFSALLALLDPDVVLYADEAAVAVSVARAAAGAPALAREMRGAQTVANVFKGRASAARPALISGRVGLMYAPGRTPVAVFEFTIVNGRIVEIGIIADRSTIGDLELVALG